MVIKFVSTLCVVAILAAARVAGAQTPEPARMPQLPLPQGWEAEHISFPLPFAPDIPYNGSLEIRFMPRMFDPIADSYFSYDYLWWIDGHPSIGADELAKDLTLYYQGLATVVNAKSKRDTPSDATHVTARATGAGRFDADVQTLDAFNGAIPLHLKVKATTQVRGDHTVIFFAIAPESAPQTITNGLNAVIATAIADPGP